MLPRSSVRMVFPGVPIVNTLKPPVFQVAHAIHLTEDHAFWMYGDLVSVRRLDSCGRLCLLYNTYRDVELGPTEEFDGTRSTTTASLDVFIYAGVHHDLPVNPCPTHHEKKTEPRRTTEMASDADSQIGCMPAPAGHPPPRPRLLVPSGFARSPNHRKDPPEAFSQPTWLDGDLSWTACHHAGRG